MRLPIGDPVVDGAGVVVVVVAACGAVVDAERSDTARPRGNFTSVSCFLTSSSEGAAK